MKVAIVIERHADGFVAYPLGVEGVVIGEGNDREAALVDVAAALKAHVDAFGVEVLDSDSPVLAAFVEEVHLG